MEGPMLLRGVLVLPVLFVLPAFAVEPKPMVSLLLTGASATRRDQDTLFKCDAVLDNATGRDLTVRSGFYSPFDGLELVVTTKEGKVLAQQPYIHHQSPFTPEGREFPVKQGNTKQTLVFPIQDFPGDIKTLKVRLVGTLPGSTYQRIVSSETLEIPVKAE
jgi:hypothetical protein